MIDWTKPLRTTGGIKVHRVLCLDSIHPTYPVLVEMMDARVVRFSIEGINKFWADDNLENYSELSDVPIDTLMWVSDALGHCWEARYFAREKDGHAVCWSDGKTSKTSYNKYNVVEWNLYSLTRPEGYTHWTDELANSKEAT